MEDGKKRWQPPPRPTELKNIHVVNLDKTPETDYFALISSKEKKPPTPIKQTTATQTPQISESTASSEPLASTPDFIQPSHAWKQTFMVLASLSLIFAGTYFLIHSLSKKTIRLPASTTPGAEKQWIQTNDSTGILHTQHPATTNFPATHQDTLGLEKPRAKVVAPSRMLPPQETVVESQNNTEPTQANESSPPPPSTSPKPQQPMTPEFNPAESSPGQLPTPPSYPPPQPNPNEGVVQPPDRNKFFD